MSEMPTPNQIDWSQTPKWIVPVANSDDAEFWAGAARGELRIQRCNVCGLHQHYPRLFCSHCGSDQIEFVTATGTGTIYSYTVIRKNGVPPFNERVPFVVASVDLDEPGARILATMPSAPVDGVAIGARVRATFRVVDEAYGFVDFEVLE